MAIIQARTKSAGFEPILTLLLTHRQNLSSDLIFLRPQFPNLHHVPNSTVDVRGHREDKWPVSHMWHRTSVWEPAFIEWLLSLFFPKKTLSSMFVEWKRILSCV